MRSDETRWKKLLLNDSPVLSFKYITAATVERSLLLVNDIATHSANHASQGQLLPDYSFLSGLAQLAR